MQQLFKRKNFSGIVLLMAMTISFSACKKLDVFEKNTTVPDHQWSYAFQPTFDFTISDTAVKYNVFIVLRHTDAYRYNNIWVSLGTQAPGDTLRHQRFDLQLGNDAKGWEGVGMDDIWEIRKSITNGAVSFAKAGTYKFSLSQVMRENPLQNIISVGVRVEKAIVEKAVVEK